MQFAVNYSPVLADLVRQGRVRLDRYKCPAWPDLLAEAQQSRPVYVHFPLVVGSGQGGPQDEEMHQMADLERIAGLADQTHTPLINTHFVPRARDYPGIDPADRSPRNIERVVSGTLRDLEPLIRRFGAERVTLENVINDFGYLTIGVLPEVIGRILDETGCGMLFDLSHARLTARNLGLDPRSYCGRLPVERIREIHVTGLQKVEGALLERIQAAPGGFGLMGNITGKWMDHFAMTDEDWSELAWMLGEISAGHWQAPWVIAFEFGGVGGFWEALSDAESYLAQVPRMAGMVNGVG